MENFEYYTEIIGPGAFTKCCKDLLSGRIKISDVPFEFRGINEYISAHKYARQFKDEKERCWQYWQIAKQLESDIWNLSIAEDTKDVKNPYLLKSCKACMKHTLILLRKRFLETARLKRIN